MAIKYTIDRSMFSQLFEMYGRGEQFSRAGRGELFEYLEQLSEDTGEDIEMDTIALCCEYSEHDAESIISQYGHIADLAECGTEEEKLEAVLSELRDNTTVLEFTDSDGKTSYIIRDF